MSVLISSSPPLPSLFLGFYQDSSTSRFPHDASPRDAGLPERQHSRPVPFKLSRTLIKKKAVVFADSLGLPLTQVKMLQDEEVPPARAPPPTSVPSVPLVPGLRLNFPQPITRLNLVEEVRLHHVRLENVLVSDLTVTGTILVHNLSFQKDVSVRYTRDYWLSYSHVAASFTRSVAPDIDQFSFSVDLPETLPLGARVELCIRAELSGEEFWDSNESRNYQMECIMRPKRSDMLVADGGSLLASDLVRRRLSRIRNTSSLAEGETYY